MLTTGFMSANSTYDFERSHPDDGSRFQSAEDVVFWYTPALHLLTELYDRGGEHRRTASELLHDHLRGLYGFVWLHDILEQTISSFLCHGSWLSGWVAVSAMIEFDGKKMNEYLDRALKLQQALAPQSLYDQLDIYVLQVGGEVYQMLGDPGGVLHEQMSELAHHLSWPRPTDQHECILAPNPRSYAPSTLGTPYPRVR